MKNITRFQLASYLAIYLFAIVIFFGVNQTAEALTCGVPGYAETATCQYFSPVDRSAPYTCGWGCDASPTNRCSTICSQYDRFGSCIAGTSVCWSAGGYGSCTYSSTACAADGWSGAVSCVGGLAYQNYQTAYCTGGGTTGSCGYSYPSTRNPAYDSTCDVTPPTASVSPGTAGATYTTSSNPLSYTATWADSGSGLATCMIYIDNAWNTIACSGASKTYTGSFAAGSHALYLYAVDNAGRSAYSSWYYYNITSPAPTVTLKANGVAVSTSVTYNNPATLTWTSTNSGTCTGTNFSTNGAVNNSTGTSTGNLFTTQTYSISCAGPDRSLAPKVDYTTGAYPIASATGDLNGDGKPDFVTTNYTANTISVLKNNGSGTFAAKVDYTTGTNPRAVAIGDLNGDGKSDLAVVNYTSNTVSVFINNGIGVFAAKVDYATGANPFSVAIGDVTSDGKADIVVANYTANTVSVFRNNGTGTFAAKVDYATGVSPRVVALADLNGDGKLDIAVTNFTNNTVSILINNGSGTFAAKVDYATGTGPNFVTTSDFNSDGKIDLAVTNYTGNTISVLTNSGTGTFGTKVDYVTATGPFAIAAGDLTGDGKADLAVSNYGAGAGNTISIFTNSGTGTFGTKMDFAAGLSPVSISLGDLNSDSKIDIVSANYGTSATASVFINNNNSATVTSSVVVHVNPVYGSCSATACVLTTGIEGQTYTNLCSNNAMSASYCGGSGGGGGSGGSWHSVCANNACIVVNGAGTNQCSSNLNCSGSYPAQYYGVCAQGTCVMVSGTDAYATGKGISSCSNYGGACPNPSGSSYNINSSGDLKLSITKKSGITCSTDVTLTIEPLSGFSDTVNLSILDWGGLATYSPTANFSRTSLTSVQYSSGATLNICAPTTAVSNNYMITVRGVGASSGKTIDRQIRVVLHNAASSTWQEI